MKKPIAIMNGKRVPVVVAEDETDAFAARSPSDVPLVGLKRQLDILGELLHDLRNLDPLIEDMPGWKKAVESGALDGWV